MSAISICSCKLDYCSVCEPAVQVPVLFLLWSWLFLISSAFWLHYLVGLYITTH